MSIRSLGDFLETVRVDRELADRLGRTFGGRTDEASVAALVGAARDAGFDVSVADVAEARRLAAADETPEALADDALDAVVGGTQSSSLEALRRSLNQALPPPPGNKW